MQKTKQKKKNLKRKDKTKEKKVEQGEKYRRISSNSCLAARSEVLNRESDQKTGSNLEENRRTSA